MSSPSAPHPSFTLQLLPSQTIYFHEHFALLLDSQSKINFPLTHNDNPSGGDIKFSTERKFKVLPGYKLSPNFYRVLGKSYVSSAWFR